MVIKIVESDETIDRRYNLGREVLIIRWSAVIWNDKVAEDWGNLIKNG